MRPFALERYFARYEFNTRYLLCASDPETMPVRDLLAYEPGSAERLAELRLGYVESRGGSALRTAIASLYERCDADSVLAHSGAEEAIFVFMNAALQRGDHAIVQFPAYQSHYSVAETLGVEITRWQSDLSGEGSPDVDELDRLIRQQTRAIVLTTPNNPTGYAFNRGQMEHVVAVARRHGLWLLGDEVYRGTEREAERIPAVCDSYERGVSLGGLSKAHGLAGLRIGWSCTRDASLYERMAALKDYLSICNSAPSEFLAELALRHNAALIGRVREIAMRNLEALDAFFVRRSRLFAWKRPRAGTTAFPRYLGGSSENFCARAVRDAGVLLLPSTAFDAGDEHVRFGYGRADLPGALATLDRFIDSQGAS
ncbi:MAG: aminotransferase class I/II-fold pyridoxal phosphate-dependent enzyme [Candidatus Eremiobacteraeota bacterium]|nr:aminotransferase class I/II-fold pyridoxal phosphate-dependent enzyme [Candidatus Eremiobacteraeota bacterium]